MAEIMLYVVLFGLSIFVGAILFLAQITEDEYIVMPDMHRPEHKRALIGSIGIALFGILYTIFLNTKC